MRKNNIIRVHTVNREYHHNLLSPEGRKDYNDLPFLDACPPLVEAGIPQRFPLP